MDFVVGKNVFGAEERLVNETKEINILYMVCGEWNQRDDDVNAVESRSLWLKREMQRTGKKLHFVASNVIQRPKRQAKRTETRIYSEQMMKIPIIFFFRNEKIEWLWSSNSVNTATDDDNERKYARLVAWPDLSLSQTSRTPLVFYMVIKIFSQRFR